MFIRGIRGATVVNEDEPDRIIEATRKLLDAILEANPGMDVGDIASAFFTVTGDLCSAYPAQAARDMGWDWVPLICAREIPVPDGLARCIRVLIHWNADLPQDKIRHVYLGEASTLRPDFSGSSL